jgi:hypothetical protein
MRRLLTLIVALGVAALFSSATLAGAECSSYHKTQASVDRPNTSKDVATAADTADGSQAQTARAEQPAKPAPAVKK